MVAVTQRINSYLGGVSKQSDDKMLPGQVRECFNGFPDATYGLTKRPGFKHIAELGTNYSNGKWFFIKRDDDEEYVGVIKGSDIDIWNAVSGNTCTVKSTSIEITANGTDSGTANGTNIATTTSGSGTNLTVDLEITNGVASNITINNEGSGYVTGDTITIAAADAGTSADVVGTYKNAADYLNGSNTDFKIITVQDTSIIVNSSVVVAEQAAPTFNPHRVASVEIQYVTSGTDYTVDITIGATTLQATYQTSSGDGVDAILTDLKADIEGLDFSAEDSAYGPLYEDPANPGQQTGMATPFTVTKLANSLEITSELAMDVHGAGGIDNMAILVVEDEVGSVAGLPIKSVHDRKVKVVNTNSLADTYWAKFIAHDGVSGEGYWQETRDPGVSPGLDNSTLPHELINTAVDTFVFQEIYYEPRNVGDDTTNPHPSFQGEKITAGFFHSNRLGFLSKDNVILSQTGDFYNFYFKSAQTTIDSDPIDISCSSTKPTALHSAMATAQGVVLFSEYQQFLMFADAGVLTPSLTTVRSLSNYEVDRNIEPVDVGTQINFVTKTPGYSRVFSMVTKGQEENPQVLDLSRVVKEWIPPYVDQLVASPQNSMIAMAGQTMSDIYLFRYYNDGKENLMEAWTSWTMPGAVQFIETNSDDMYAVTKVGSHFTLSKAALSQSPEEAIIVNNEGQKVNPCIDLYKNIDQNAVIWDPANNRTKCYIPYLYTPNGSPVIVIKGDTSTGDFVESGFTIRPEVGSDANGPTGQAQYFFIVPNKNLTAAGEDPLNVADDVIIGYDYDFEVELPRTYYRPEPKETDFTANLTIARMKFAVGLSGMMSFKLKQKGRLPYSVEFTGDGTTQTFPFNREELNFNERSDVKVSINGAETTRFTIHSNGKSIIMTDIPAAGAVIKVYIDEWFNVHPTIQANTYLANDVPLDSENVFTIPIHQRTENFRLKMFNNSPFPVAINSMMWEGKYTPRFYKRV